MRAGEVWFTTASLLLSQLTAASHLSGATIVVQFVLDVATGNKIPIF